MSQNELRKDKSLHRGDSLTSKNGKWKAIFQDNGNFVICGCGLKWESETGGSDVSRLTMRADSDLVMYNDADVARWHTDTFVPMPRPPHHGHRYDCHLELTDDGELLLHRGPHIPWRSSESKGVKMN